MNLLYYGDNLDVLRRHVENESVDLIYSKRISYSQRRRGSERRGRLCEKSGNRQQPTRDHAPSWYCQHSCVPSKTPPGTGARDKCFRTWRGRQRCSKRLRTGQRGAMGRRCLPETRLPPRSRGRGHDRWFKPYPERFAVSYNDPDGEPSVSCWSRLCTDSGRWRSRGLDSANTIRSLVREPSRQFLSG